MTEDVKITDSVKTRSLGKRVGLFMALILLVLIALIVGGRVFLTTTAGARFIENQINMRSFGPIEQIEISGLSGDPLGQFTLASLRIKDKDGLWLNAETISIEWRPISLMRRHVDIEDITINSIDILRRPALKTGGEPQASNLPKLSMGSLRLETVNLDARLMGRDASVRVEGRFQSESSGQMTSLLNVSGLKPEGDQLSLDFSRTPSGRLSGALEISAAPDGPIAALVKAPPRTSVSGTGQIDGTLASGEGALTLNFDGENIIQAQSNWTEIELAIEGRAALTAWPALDQISGRIGGASDFAVRVNRDPKEGFKRQAFTANLLSENLTLSAQGQLSDGGGRLESAQISAAIAQPGRLISLPSGYEIGRSEIKGAVTFAPRLGFKGRVSTAKIVTQWGSSGALNGPVTLVHRADNRLGIDLDITAQTINAGVYSDVLGPNAFLGLTAQYDPADQVLTTSRFELKSGDQDISAQGRVSADLIRMDIQGRAALTLPDSYAASSAIPSGTLASDFSLKKTPESDIALSADGRYDLAQSLGGPLEGIVGAQLIYSAAVTPIEGGVSVDRFRLETSGAVTEISGIIKEQLDLSGELQTLNPMSFETVNLDADTRASFQIFGPRDDLAVRLEATSPNLHVNSFNLESLRLRAEFSNLNSAPSGPVQFEAVTEYGDLTGQAQLALGDSKRAKEIEISLGDIRANGDVAIDGDNRASGAINIRLADDGARSAIASLTLTPQGQEQGLVFNLEAENVAYQKFGFDTVLAKAEGTLERLTASIEAKGVYDPSSAQHQFELSSPVVLARGQDQSLTVSATPNLLWNELAITSRSAVTLALSSADINLIAPLSVDGNDIDLTYRRQPDREALTARGKTIPISVLPLPGVLADSRGRLSADVNVSYDRGELGGTTRLALSDWRGFQGAVGKGVNAEANINFGPSSRWTLDGSSALGFSFSGKGGFSITQGASLSGTRLDMSAPVTGDFTANGPAETLLGLLTPAIDDMGGQLNMALSLSGSAANPLLKGQAQGRNLKFEVPEIGTQIRQGSFLADFTNDTVTLSSMTLRDRSDGTLKAQGDFKLGEFGKPMGTGTLTVTKFTALDRRDITAILDGSLKFESTKKTSALSGDIIIDKANLRQFVSGAASVVEIEVEEINRPPELDPIIVRSPSNPIGLEISIRAPRNILVNSRGLDIELAVDAKVTGTIEEPQFFGTANVLRGGYKIAGKTLAFQSGRIEFNGPLDKAKVSLKAQTETQNMTASVDIAGTVQAPQFTLSSTPERPQDEILSALLFGRSATELSALESLQLAGALAQFSGVGSGFDLLGGLRESLGVSQLNIGTAADGTTQISGGRYLAENVYLQLFSGTTLNQTGAIIDWEIRPNIALRSKILADNDQSLSLKWKKDF